MYINDDESYQDRVNIWLIECLGFDTARNKLDRSHRFLEEALELAQSTGTTKEEALELLDYVYDRPAGEPYQEVGGVMVTLAGLCLANDLNMHENGETELRHVWSRIDKVREKKKNKPLNSPLPGLTEKEVNNILNGS